MTEWYEEGLLVDVTQPLPRTCKMMRRSNIRSSVVTAFTGASLMGLTLMLAIPFGASGCAQLAAVGQDIGNIASIVIADVMAGKPFAQILADTGTADASLLVAIIQAIEGDPNLDAATKAKYVAACAPYLEQAKAMVAAQAVHP